jgi:hypothetical protein
MTFAHLLNEVNQGHTVRRHLYGKLEKQLKQKVRVVAFFTSFRYPGLLQDVDAEMLEEVLQNTPLDDKELLLLINSPGGEALPAERIVNICRSYSQGKFRVIVPKMAKSAATMICLGANKIGMSKTSELGPIDPQIAFEDERGHTKQFAAHEIIESYNELIKKANLTRRRVEPYLQQLARFDARDIRRIRSAQDLSENIAIRCLQSGVFSGLSANQIRAKIKPFLEPKLTQVHGRPIYYDQARACGLDVELHDIRSDLWRVVWELFVRLNYTVNHSSVKVIESSEHYWVAPLQMAPASD